MSNSPGRATALQPWRVVDSHVTFQDRWLTVRTDRCRTPAGVEVTPYHVLEYPHWINIVALTKGNLDLLMIREYRHGAAAVLDGLVGGIVEHDEVGPGEDVAARTARRELREETGYTTARPLQRILSGYANPATQANMVLTYLALDVERAADPRLDQHEAIEVYTRPFADVLKDVRDGRLTMQSYHVAALWTAAALFLSGAPGLEPAAPLGGRLAAALLESEG